MADDNVVSIIPQLLTADELAQHLRFDVSLIRRMAREGKLPCHRIRNGCRSYFRFDLAEVGRALHYEAPALVPARLSGQAQKKKRA